MMKRFTILAAVFFALTCSAGTAIGETIHVARDGSDVSGIGSDFRPYQTVQMGIGMADSGDTVRVRPGVYHEIVHFNGKAITVTSIDPDDPSVVASTIIQAIDNRYVVGFTDNESVSSVLTGFTITGGNFRGWGGIRCDASPTITKNVITQNTARPTANPDMGPGGGGISVMNGSPTITYNTITENSSHEGGGIACWESSNPLIFGNTITGNTASRGGGGIICYDSAATISNNIITGNTTEDWQGGGILVQSDSNATITDNIISGNTANAGGGIAFQDNSGGAVTGCVVNGNVSMTWGGAGIHCRNYDSVTVTNSVICGNVAWREGGGGILCEGQGTAHITNCTIAQNETRLNAGGGIAAEFGSVATVSNCILAGNIGPLSNELAVWGSGAVLNVAYSDVIGGPGAVYNDNATLNWDSGNMDADPRFASLGHWGSDWIDGDYHLKSREGRWDPAAGGGLGAWVVDAANSPCIDAGNPADSWADEPGPNGAWINMGAYGNTAFASKSLASITMTLTPSGSGTVSPSPGVHQVSSLTPVALTASPAPLHSFANWSAIPCQDAVFDNLISPSTSVTIFGDVTLTAHFALKIVDTPVLSPPGGSYSSAQMVSISCNTVGAAIRYTTDGSLPTAASAAYSTPISVSTPTTIRAIASKFDYVDSDVAGATYVIDTVGPTVEGMGTVPSEVREGLDNSISLIGTADDVSTGGLVVTGAEFFVGSDPGVGNGTAMGAADGQFDEPIEGLVGTVDTVGWTVGNWRVYARARDAAGSWGSASSILVPVVDGMPPGAVNNLAIEGLGSLQALSASIDDVSSEAPAAGANLLLDGNAASFWQTAGSTAAETEHVTFDVGAVEQVAAVALTPSAGGKLFPQEFQIEVSEDKAAWTRVYYVQAFKANKTCTWQFEAVDARYVRVSGPGVKSTDRRYYWQIADGTVYAGAGTLARATWTAPADNGYLGMPASQYDIRYSYAPITAANFHACAPCGSPTAPRPPGTQEQALLCVPYLPGQLYFALKSADDIPNWSGLSNVPSVPACITGCTSLAPPDNSFADALIPPQFEFAIEDALKATQIVFSSCPGFVRKPTPRPDGQIDRTKRFGIRPGTEVWTPSKGQWKALKKIVCTEAVLYWRVKGKSRTRGTYYGPVRSVYFDTGVIQSLSVSPSHTVNSEEAVWPVPQPPTFMWANMTNGMMYFHIDVSTDPTIPMKDRKRTVTIARRGVTGTMYIPNAGEWKKIRQLATWLRKRGKPIPGEGTLYWRVRATDSDRLLSCTSGVKTLIVDGGSWIVGDLDLTTESPAVSWDHVGDGIVKYGLEFSHDGSFGPTARETVKAPGKTLTTTSYAYKAGEVTRLQKFAARNGVTSLYYRVRGENADRKFVTYSDAGTTPVP